MTPGDIIALSLRTAGVVGVGQTPDSQDTNDALAVCNMMLAEWQRQRWLIWNLIDISHTSTGAVSYTVGTGGDFNVTRPDRLQAAYARLLPVTAASPVDFPLGLIASREDYSAITLKQLQTFPTSIFYDSAYPLGSVYPVPVPPSGKYEIHLIIKEQLAQFTDLVTPIATPPEYLNAILWNLSVRLRPLFQLAPDPVIVGLAKTALNVIRGANAQVPTLGMPLALANGGYGADPMLGNLNGLPFAI